MKIIAAGDIHGSFVYADYLIERIAEHQPKKVVLLGDIYEYFYSRELDNILLSSGVITVSVEGNCDYFATKLSRLEFVGDNLIERTSGRQFLFTHGHIYNGDYIPKFLKDGDVLIYGHMHNTNIVKENGIYLVNAGSVGMPRNNSKHSFVLIDGDKIEIREVENGNLIDRLQLD
ncbi:MAG: YfcE family phosphodiesterase [Clostridiales bacterium]|nr:YfcE family phosphodiesterase [Clostridiales bacterium]